MYRLRRFGAIGGWLNRGCCDASVKRLNDRSKMIDKHRWEKFEKIYHAALEHEPDERAAFVSNECAGDHELESEVGSLLKFDGRANAFMETSALNVAAK